MDNNYKYQKVLVLGSGQLAYKCAEIVREYINDVCVLELKVTESTTLEKLCTKSRIPYLCVTKPEMTDILLKVDTPTLVISAGNTYLFSEKIIGKENLTIINWHNALLPRHKGRNAEVWAIYDGDEQTGVTWHYVTGDVDAGNIIGQSTIDIGESMTAMKLYKLQTDVGAAVFGECIEEILKGNCSSQKQQECEEEQMHFSWEIPNNGRLDTNWEMSKICRFLRAMDYGSLLLMGRMYVQLEDKKYSFYRYKIKSTEEWQTERILRQDGCNLRILEKNQEIILRDIQEEV